jgi:intracellular sulfur oxidation DsrE/DsrF family protein
MAAGPGRSIDQKKRLLCIKRAPLCVPSLTKRAGGDKSECGILIAFTLALSASPSLAANRASHRIVIQVSENDPPRMNLALSNTQNAINYYSGKGDSIHIEIVAYGPGLNMPREDTSPVKDRIKAIKASEIGGDIRLSACHNTRIHRHQARVTRSRSSPKPAGVVGLTQLEEQGWSYLRP